MSKRERIKTTTKVERRKRIVTYVTVEKEIVVLGPVVGGFAAAVRRLRQDSLMTQQQLADAVGMSRTSITNIELGRQRVLLEDLWSFAKAFDLPPMRLFTLVNQHVVNQ